MTLEMLSVTAEKPLIYFGGGVMPPERGGAAAGAGGEGWTSRCAPP